MKGRSKGEYRDKVQALLDQIMVNQAVLAEMMGVAPSLISLVLKGEREPSIELLVRLGIVAIKHDLESQARWFLQEAGIDATALDRFIDMRVAAKAAPAFDFVHIPSIDPKNKGTIPFPSSRLDNPASTRFIRLGSSGKPFNIGDIVYNPPLWPTALDTLLIDPGQKDLREITHGDFVAVRIKSRDGRSYHDYAGPLIKFYSGDHTRFTLSVIDDKIYIGIAVSQSRSQLGPITMPGLDSEVLGRVIAWISNKEKKS